MRDATWPGRCAEVTMRLLLTGGTGFFGRALLRHLHASAALRADKQPPDVEQLVVVSRNPQAFAHAHPTLAVAPWLQWVQADVCDAAALANVRSCGPLDAVLHAATDSTNSGNLTPLARLDQIVVGTRNVLDLAVALQARRFLLTSSGGVYGPQPPHMAQIPETYCGIPDPLLPSSSYGLGKRMAEHLCSIYSQTHGLETVIARCFAFIGQDLPLNAHFAIGNFIRDALHGDSIIVKGDGTPLRSYMDQTDLAHWLFSLLQRGRSGHTYNVGSDHAISIAKLARLVRDLIAPGKPVEITGSELLLHKERNRYIPSIDKATKELDLQISINLNDAITQAAVAHRR